jgi:hypothetical protein
MSMGCLSKFSLCAALTASVLPAFALDFSPLVLRRADTQGLVSELFLYDLTPPEVHQLRQRLLQPVLDDTLTVTYEPTLADLVPVAAEGPGDKLLNMLRPASAAQRGQAEDTVLIVFQGTTLHARRYRMPTRTLAFNSALSNGAAKSVRPEQTVAMLKPDLPADAKSMSEGSNAAAVSDITSAVKRWARAWEQRDMVAYAAAYEADFRGAGGLSPAPSRDAWLAQRRERILSKRDIAVTLEDVQISLVSGARTDLPTANARFLQRYRGDAVISVARKRLGLVLRDGVWLIREEVSL